jgi:hypothetical protein
MKLLCSKNLFFLPIEKFQEKKMKLIIALSALMLSQFTFADSTLCEVQAKATAEALVKISFPSMRVKSSRAVLLQTKSEAAGYRTFVYDVMPNNSFTIYKVFILNSGRSCVVTQVYMDDANG